MTNIQSLITRCEREYQRRAMVASIGSKWRPARSVMRGPNWFAERNPRNRTGIEGPYRRSSYSLAWWLAMFAATLGAILLVWIPPAPPL